MNRMEKGKYSELIRGDYLQQLARVRKSRDRDECIQEAIQDFLQLPPEQRRREAAGQRVDILHPAESEPDYYMWLEIVSLPDELVERLEKSDVYYHSTKRVNAAIRLWLERKAGVQGLKP